MPKLAPVSAEIPPEVAGAAAVISSGRIPTPQLVEAAYALRQQIADAQANLNDVEASLIALGKGKHSGVEEAHTVTIVEAIPGHAGKIVYVLDDKDVEKAKALEAKARELADTEFPNLFDRRVLYTPCEGFAAVAPKLLTPAKAEKLLALCAREGKPYAGQRAQVRYA